MAKTELADPVQVPLVAIVAGDKLFIVRENDPNPDEPKFISVDDLAKTTDVTDAAIEAAYNNQVPIITQAEAEAGLLTTVRRITPERIAQAIAALSSGEIWANTHIEKNLTQARYPFSRPFVGPGTITEEFPSGLTTIKYDVASENGAWDDNSGSHRTLTELNTWAAARGASEHWVPAAVIEDEGTGFDNRDELTLMIKFT